MCSTDRHVRVADGHVELLGQRWHRLAKLSRGCRAHGRQRGQRVATVGDLKHFTEEQKETAKKLGLKLDYDFNGEANVVESYISYLRRKIDAPFGRHDLETVRGAGYRMSVETG